MYQKEIVLKRKLKEKIFFISLMIFFMFSVFIPNSNYIYFTILVLLLLVYIIATIRVFTRPHIRVTNEFIYLSPSPLWKTYKISLSEIKLIQQIEQRENTVFLFSMSNDVKIKYIPQMQDSQLIEEIITVITCVDNLNKHWKGNEK